VLAIFKPYCEILIAEYFYLIDYFVMTLQQYCQCGTPIIDNNINKESSAIYSAFLHIQVVPLFLEILP